MIAGEKSETVRADQLISVVAPLHNQSQVVKSFIAEATALLSTHYEQYEILLIDDGSSDDTAAVMEAMLLEFAGIRCIKLTRHFGFDVAISAGLDSAIGDFVVVLIPGFDPVELIPEFIGICSETNSVVMGKIKNRNSFESAFTRLARAFYLSVIKSLFNIRLPDAGSYFICLNRHAIYQITRTKDKNRYLKAITSFIGLSVERVEYLGRSDGPTPLRSFWQSLNLSIDVIVMNSTRPLRLVSIISFAATLVEIIYIGYVVMVYVFKNDVAAGWATLSFQHSIGYIVVLLSIGTIAEYMGALINESRDRPLYYISDDKSSRKPILNYDRVNVVTRSEI